MTETSPTELPAAWRSTAITVVIPTYNEADNLPAVIAAVTGIGLDGLSILVVDDNSPDGTGKLADELAEGYNKTQAESDRPGRMNVLHRAEKDGLGRAYIAGMTQALEDGAQYVVQMDADGSHPYTAIPAMLGAALATGADVVTGSRYVSGGSVDADWSWRRKALSAFANFYVNRILRTRIRDVTSGFNLWHRATLEALDLKTIKGSSYSFQVEMKYRASQDDRVLLEIPIHFVERAAGSSKMTLAVQLESAWRPWRLLFTRSRP
ncbi:polyprenol monophosphomannose synthase [Amycolatopsis sp.]|uniref:polyprenol monophosphomannose synthase n=1 Tax=Amycolatopsis sp. TaxID=37632 RepID=UPI002DFEB10E|nr:polyprenol monophosphomannose synthase [Amycolatopsis sp.]